MKILIISPYSFDSKLSHGGARVCYDRIKRLSSKHKIILIAFCHGNNSEQPATADISLFCSEVIAVPHTMTTWSRLKARFLSIFTLQPSGIYLWKSRQMRLAIKTSIDKFKPDIVLFQFQQMAQYIHYCQGVKSIIDIQDALSISQYRFFVTQKSFLKKIIRFLDWVLWIRYESRFYHFFDKVITLTTQDKIGLRIYNPHLKIESVPVGIDLPNIDTSVDSRRNIIVFFGYFSHRANVDAVLYFVDEIFPHIVEAVPDVRLEIAGDNPPEEILTLSSPNIKIKGYVHELRDFLSSAKVVVIPLRYGGGIKIKTLEALANGCAIVSTSIGAEETGAVNGKELFVCDSPIDFAQKVVLLLSDDRIASILRKNARELIERYFSTDAEVKRLNDILDEVVQ